MLALPRIALADPPAAEAAPTEEREILRIGVAGGVGVASEPSANDRGPFGIGTANVHAFPIRGLDIGASLDVLSYSRTYVTTMPNGNGSTAGLRVGTSERLVRSRLTVGFEVLHFVVHNDAVSLTPYVVFDATSFVSAAFPQTPISLGGGGALEAKLGDRARLLATFDYTRVVNTSRPAVQDLLYFGALTGDFRFDLGVAYAASQTTRIELRYRGEVQLYEHDARAFHALIVGPSFSIR